MQAPSAVTTWLTILGVMLLVACLFLAKSIADLDLWGVMSMGAWLDQNPGQFPYQDLFSYTNLGQPWIYHEWGSGVLFFQMLKNFGSESLLLLKWLLFSFTLGISYWTCRQQDDSALMHRVFLLAMPVVIFLLLPAYLPTIRCHEFSLLFYAVFLNLLSRQKHLWALPLLMIFWVNLHGGFAMGLVLLSVYLIWAAWERRWRDFKTLAMITTLTSLAMLLNPYGVHLLSELVDAWSMNRDQITEWQNVLRGPGPHGWVYTGFLILVLGAASWRAVKSWQGWSIFPGIFVLLILTGVKGFMHAKLSPFFVLTAISVGLPWLLPAKIELKPLPLGGFLFGKALPIGLVLMSGSALMMLLQQPNAAKTLVPDINTPEGKVQISYPVSATDFLKQHKLRGNLWARFEWGEYLYWTLYPNIRVACDGRYETTYTGPACDDMLNFYQKDKPEGQHALATLERYPQTTLVMIPTKLKFLTQQFENSATWQLIYRDPRIVLYRKGNLKVKTMMGEVLREKRTLDASLGILSRFQAIRR